MTTILLALLLAQAPGPAPAPTAVIVGRTDVPAGSMIFLDASGSISARPLRWKLLGTPPPDLAWFNFDRGSRPNVALFAPAPGPGLYRFALIAAGPAPKAGDEDPAIDVDVFEVRVGSAPIPVPPIPIPYPPGPTPPPPIPTPTPIPPQPIPTPQAPTRLRVLMLWDAARSARPETVVAYGSTAIRAYASAHAPEGANGDGFRSWRYDADVSRATAEWQAAFKAAVEDPGPLPKMVLLDPAGRVVASERITTEAAALAALRSRGGP